VLTHCGRNTRLLAGTRVLRPSTAVARRRRQSTAIQRV